MSGKNKSYLHFTPEAIIDMDLNPDTNEQIGYVILKNISDSPVGYKFRCSNKNDITVQPAIGVLGDAEEKQVTVSYLNWHPDHSQHEKLQVLVTPLDDLYHADQNLHELFKRTTDVDVQEHRLHIQYGTPRTPIQAQERKVSTVAPVPTPTPVPSRKVFMMPSVKPQEAPSVTTGSAHTHNPVYQPQNSVKEVHEIHHPVYRSGTDHPAHDRGHSPHFTINYPENKVRTRSQSSICNAKQLPIINDLMTSDHPWRFLLALLMLVGLFILLVFAIRMGIHYRRRKSFVEGVSMFGESAISSTATAVAELGESLFEDYRKMTLDEYIHWKMT